MGTTRAGRKRKAGVARHPGGKIVQSAQQYDNPQALAALRRIKQNLERLVTDPRFGSQLGLLAVEEYIDPEEYDAGLSWAELTYREAQVQGLMLPKTKAIDWGGSQGRSLAQEPSEDAIELVKAKKHEADRRINDSGMGAMRECMRVIIMDQEPDNRLALKRALRALVSK